VSSWRPPVDLDLHDDRHQPFLSSSLHATIISARQHFTHGIFHDCLVIFMIIKCTEIAR